MTLEILADITTAMSIQEELAPYASKIKDLEKRTIHSQIDTRWQAEQALQIAAEAKILNKKIEAIRKNGTSPVRKFLQKINDSANSMSERLESIEEVIKDKIQTWNADQSKEGFSTIEDYTYCDGEVKIELDLNQPGTLRSQDAIAYQKEVWEFKIIDLEDVPEKYLKYIVDEEAVQKQIEAGIRNIPGLEINKTTKTVIRSR